MSLRVFIIQSGMYGKGDNPEYSVTSRRQLESIEKLGCTVSLGLVTSRTSISGIRENIKRLKKEIGLFKPDVVHSHYGSIVSFVALKSALKVPLVISFCGDDLLGTPISGIRWRIREFITQKISKYTASRSKRILVKSPNLLDQLTPKQKEKTVIIPNGINADFFKPLQNRTATRAKLGWGKDQFVVFFNASSGSNKKVKNIELAQASIQLFMEKVPNVLFHQVERLPPNAFRDQLAASDCLLLTSLHEGSPNVVKEALACNVPVVSVSCGDVLLRLAGVNKGGVFPYSAEILAAQILAVSENRIEFNGREMFFNQQLDEPSIGIRIKRTYQLAIENN